MKGHTIPAGTAGRSVRTWRPRALHLVDVDNLVGDPITADAARIGATLGAYRAVADWADGDHVAMACSREPGHAFAVSAAWPSVRTTWRGGTDGADLALLDVASWAVEVGGFDRAVIGSGDRIFLCALEVLERAGVAVTVVSRPSALAAALRTRARNVRFLPDVRLGVAA